MPYKILPVDYAVTSILHTLLDSDREGFLAIEVQRPSPGVVTLKFVSRFTGKQFEMQLREIITEEPAP